MKFKGFYALESFNIVGNINFIFYSQFIAYNLRQSSVEVKQKNRLVQNACFSASSKVKELQYQRSDTPTKEKVRTPTAVERHTA